ncbi:MAG: hypothetical protein ACLSS9_13440 [Acutalibacteraceae bacterium]
MNIKINRKTINRLCAIVLLAAVLWLIIFEIPFFFTPLRFMPQEITVYRYGESVTLTDSDAEFHKLYHRLRDAGKGTIAHLFSEDAIMDSHIGNTVFYNEEAFFCDQAIVVYVKYDSMQKGRLLKTAGDEYDLVAFVMDGEQSSAVDKYLTDGVAALYKSSENTQGYRMFANYGSLDKAAKYIDSMDFSKFI